MIEAGQMTLDTFIARQSTWVAQLVQQYSGTTLAIKLPPSPSCPQCGRRCASAPARAVPSGRAAPLPGLQGARCRSIAPGAWASPLPARRPDAAEFCRHAGRSEWRGQPPAPRDSQHTPPSQRYAHLAPLATGPDEKAFSPRIASAAIPVIDMLPSMVKGPDAWIAPWRCQETPRSTVFGAGARRWNNGSLCARMCREGFRPQPTRVGCDC